MRVVCPVEDKGSLVLTKSEATGVNRDAHHPGVPEVDSLPRGSGHIGAPSQLRGSARPALCPGDWRSPGFCHR